MAKRPIRSWSWAHHSVIQKIHESSRGTQTSVSADSDTWDDTIIQYQLGVGWVMSKAVESGWVELVGIWLNQSSQKWIFLSTKNLARKKGPSLLIYSQFGDDWSISISSSWVRCCVEPESSFASWVNDSNHP